MRLGDSVSGLGRAKPKPNPHREGPLDSVLQDVIKKYPVMAKAPWKIGPGEKKGPKDGPIEFFHPEEGRSPHPGKAYLEVRDPNIKGDALKRMVFGDMLHMLPDIDPTFARVREAFKQTMTPEQKRTDIEAYQYYVTEKGETRPFEDWFEYTRLDAHLRGYLAPDERNEWKDAFTPQQKKLLGALQKHLEKKQ